MKKRIVSLVLLLCLMGSLLPQGILTASAVDASRYCGREGDNLTWTFAEETGVLTVSGSGAMADYDHEEDEDGITAPWFGYGIQAVIIEPGVTSVGEYAFSGCYELTSVTIPSSVNRMGTYAFYDCWELKEVYIEDVSVWCETSFCTYGSNPLSNGASLYCNGNLVQELVVPENVTVIAPFAFSGCTSLTSVTLLYGVTSIGADAFGNCNNLESVSIPYSVTSIGDAAFGNCEALISVVIPDSVTELGSGAFSYCTRLSSVTISDNVTSVDAFTGCSSLESVIIPEGVTSIGEYAFSECTSLKSVVIPNSVTSIEYCAFCDCSELTNLTVPENVVSIGEGAFNGTGIFNDSANWVDDVLYLGDYLLEARYDLSGICNIREGTRVIADAAFRFRDGITDVTIPQSVETIGMNAFEGCAGLTSLTISEGVRTIGYGAFTSCNALNAVTVPGTVTDFGSSAFYCCESLKSVIISEGVTSVGDLAFYGCIGLESVSIPGSVTSLGEMAFYNTGLSACVIPEGVASIGDRAFSLCPVLTEVTLPNSLTHIGIDVFTDTAYYNDKANWIDGVLYIGKHLIKGETELTGDYIVKARTLTIGGEAFYGCYGMQSVEIPDSVTHIGNGAFRSCVGLTSVTIPESVVSLGDSVFYDCENLGEVNLPDSLTSIGAYLLVNTALYNDSENWTEQVLYVGNHLIVAEWDLSGDYTVRPGALTIADFAFLENHDVTSVTVADSVIAIGRFAFDSENGVERVVILNPNCAIYPGRNTLGLKSDGVLCGVPSSTVQIYGQEYGYRFHQLCNCRDYSCAYDIQYTKLNCDTGVYTYTCENCDYSYEEAAYSNHSYVLLDSKASTCTEAGFHTYSCKDCGLTKTKKLGMLAHRTEDASVITAATCTKPGLIVNTCAVCAMTVTKIVPPTGHDNYLQDNGLDHVNQCLTCGNTTYYEHSFRDGYCICDAFEGDYPAVDNRVRIYHTLDLASDISIKYVVSAATLADYDSFYLECTVPSYKDDNLNMSKVVLTPELRGPYYYFVLKGITAVQMGDDVTAVLRMTKNGKEVISVTDEYSVAEYACSQLEKEENSDLLKTVCADLLRYGTAAQIFKGYRTNVLADRYMAPEYEGYLSDITELEFGNTNVLMDDLDAPEIVWKGKGLILDSKVVLRFIFSAEQFAGKLGDLTMKVRYQNNKGENVETVVSDPVVYNAGKSLYAFDFDGLKASELRTAVTVVIYEGDRQVSASVCYTADTYGNKTEGTLRDLCKALFAYSDSARAFFK